MRENRNITSIIQMLLGTALTAASFGLIIIPQGFAAAGVTGFSKIVIGIIPVSLSVMVLAVNMILLTLGLIFVGRAFAAKTVAVSVLFPVMLELFSKYPLTGLNNHTAIAIIFGGIMLGLGAGLVLRSGASSGGFDILAVIISKKVKVSVATVLNICDAAIILMQAVRNPIADTLYGILVITISARIVNLVVNIGINNEKTLVFRYLIKQEA